MARLGVVTVNSTDAYVAACNAGLRIIQISRPAPVPVMQHYQAGKSATASTAVDFISEGNAAVKAPRVLVLTKDGDFKG